MMKKLYRLYLYLSSKRPRITDWDIQVDRRFIQPYLGSHKLCNDKDCDDFNCNHDAWGRDFYYQFLGLHLYLAIAWR